MKTTDILKWVCRESINGEHLNYISVPEKGEHEWEQNETWWLEAFGGVPPCAIPSGCYLYFYESNVCESVTDERGCVIDYDTQIEIPTYNGFDYINLYRVD